jgi:hypothetical protein
VVLEETRVTAEAAEAVTLLVVTVSRIKAAQWLAAVAGQDFYHLLFLTVA